VYQSTAKASNFEPHGYIRFQVYKFRSVHFWYMIHPKNKLQILQRKVQSFHEVLTPKLGALMVCIVYPRATCWWKTDLCWILSGSVPSIADWSDFEFWDPKNGDFLKTERTTSSRHCFKLEPTPHNPLRTPCPWPPWPWFPREKLLKFCKVKWKMQIFDLHFRLAYLPDKQSKKTHFSLSDSLFCTLHFI
jgi:hypothetical protein